MNNESNNNNFISLENRDTRVMKLEQLNKTYNQINNNNINEFVSNEYVTKGRKTLNPSEIHLLSPKKEILSRSKRITLFRNSAKKAMKEYENEFKKQNNNNQCNIDILSNLTFGDGSLASSQIIDDSIKNNDSINKNERYKFLIKKIAKKLKKRVKLPTCKIFKFYYSYRMLIMRIAQGIKKTAKKLNFWEKWDNNITEKEINEIQEIASTSCKILQKGNIKSKKRELNVNISPSKKSKNINKDKFNYGLLKKAKKKEQSIIELNTIKENTENNKNITFLNNLDSSKENKNFINQFSDFLNKNNIEIRTQTKIPIFKNNNNKYLLLIKDFWIKYIYFISEYFKNTLSIYNFIDIIEQYYIWIDDNNNNDFNNKIIEQIKLLFDVNTINNFLISNKLNDLNDLFIRYKNIHSFNKYKEIKINDEECQCETCKSLYYDKVINYNKKNNQILFSKENNLSYETKNNKKIKETKKTGKYYKDKEIDEYFSTNEENKEYKNNKSRRKSGSKRKSLSKNKETKPNKIKKNNKMKEEYILDLMGISLEKKNSEEK